MESQSSLALATQPQNGMIPFRLPRSILEMTSEQVGRLELMAEMLAGSQLSYKGSGSKPLSKGDLFIIMMKGLSVGMSEMAALESIDLIAGKPCLDGQGMLGLAYSSGELEDITIDATDERCIVMMKRRGMSAHTEVFGDAEASAFMTTEWVNGQKQVIPLINKANYKNQKRTMYKWRAIAACNRVVFADKLQGLGYTKEELASLQGMDVNVTEDGRMTVVASTARPAQPTPPKTNHAEETLVREGEQDERIEVKLPKWLIGDQGDKNFELLISKLMEKLNLADKAVFASEMKLLMDMDKPFDPASWAKYPKGSDAFDAVFNASKHRAQSMQPATPKKPKYGKSEGTTFTDDHIAVMDGMCAGWYDDEMNASLTPDVALAALGKIGWSEFKTLEDAERALKNYCLERNLPIVTEKVTYYGKTTPMSLTNGMFGVQMRGRKQFRDIGWAETVDAWDAGQYILPEKVVIAWEKVTPEKGETYYQVVEDGITLLSDIAF